MGLYFVVLLLPIPLLCWGVGVVSVLTGSAAGMGGGTGSGVDLLELDSACFLPPNLNSFHLVDFCFLSVCSLPSRAGSEGLGGLTSWGCQLAYVAGGTDAFGLPNAIPIVGPTETFTNESGVVVRTGIVVPAAGDLDRGLLSGVGSRPRMGM